MRMTKLIAVAALAAAAIAPAGTVQAQQSWPARAVTLVVPYGPGASNDTFTRALAAILSKKLGQPFVVENRPGAGGFTGSSSVVKANPDGYTWLESPNSIASFKSVSKLDLDPASDLQPVAMLARSPIGMVVPGSLPVKTVQEFIDYARKNSDKTYYGLTGIGTTQHLHAELFNHLAGLKMKGINYKSSAETQTDLVAGRLQLMFVTVASTLGQIQAGQLRLLAYTNDSSPPSAPKAPLISASGIKGMEGAQSWWGIFAPKGVPADILKKMNEAINDALKDPQFIALIAKSGASPAPMSIENFSKEVAVEGALLGKIAKDANIKIEN